MLRILFLLSLTCPLAALASEESPYPDAQITEKSVPIKVEICSGEKPERICRSAKIGILDGKLVAVGDLPADRAMQALMDAMHIYSPSSYNWGVGLSARVDCTRPGSDPIPRSCE